MILPDRCAFRRVSVSALLLALCSAAGVAWAAPNEVKITELAPGVYFRKAQTEPKFTGCNQGWVVFKDYVLVIDANFPGQAAEVIQTIRKYTDKPIRFVFDTHYHGDHADGNPQYVKIGATVVAHERSQALFRTKGTDGFARAQQDPNRKEEYGPLEYAIPSLYFSHKLIFDDGNQRVELVFLGHAHTAGDAVAWVPKHGILFTGDACVNGAFNYTGDSNTESWISVLTAMEELGVKQVAPGHGELAGKELLGTQRRYFVELRAALRKAIDAGQTLEQIKKEIDVPSYKEWTGVDVKTRVENIEHVHRELTAGKRPLEEDGKFGAWQKTPAGDGYAKSGLWEQIGECAADRRWSKLADLYLAADTSRRRQIREYFQARPGELDAMMLYVRRMGKRLRSADDVEWMRRGLAIAAVEGGRRDYRDTIVSLVLLRYAAERVEIACDPLLRQIQGGEYSAPENKPLFENARTHAASDVAATVLAFGPQDWVDEVNRRSGK
jgi:glyoxylase-like metal-dependent hydrolase (beta-lactamase superfamily II)